MLCYLNVIWFIYVYNMNVYSILYSIRYNMYINLYILVISIY